jgi:probable F420-dependent oxidoreductase
MKYGTGYALAALPDPIAVRDFGQALDGAGFDFTAVGGHVLSQPAGTHERPPMTYVGPFYDHFVLYSYLAAVTERIHFISSIIILPEWPTAIVAKQAAELQFFSRGRFELGIGISWSEPEYKAMGQNIKNRGRRVEEQVDVLRKLWSEPFVTFEGKYHSFDNIGLNRLPAQPIPVWFGTTFDEKVMQRVARQADGWMPLGDPTEKLPELKKMMEAAGRDPSKLMVRSGVTAGEGGAAAWVEAGKKLQAGGVTHINIAVPPELSGQTALDRAIECRNALAGALG